MPEIREDVIDAYRFVQDGLNEALAKQSWSIDPTRVSGWGASAGGAAVILFAADVIANNLPPLRAIVPVYPVADFLTWGRQRPRADWDALCMSNPAVGEAQQFLLDNECVTGQLWVPEGAPRDPLLAAREVYAGGVSLRIPWNKLTRTGHAE